MDTATISYRVADFLKKYPPFHVFVIQQGVVSLEGNNAAASEKRLAAARAFVPLGNLEDGFMGLNAQSESGTAPISAHQPQRREGTETEILSSVIPCLRGGLGVPVAPPAATVSSSG